MTVRTVLADDVADIRLLLRLWLPAEEFDVVGEAENGRQLIEVAAAQQPDLVVLDLAMPDMDGLEALPRVLDVSPGSAVVILTGFDRDDFADAAYALGAAGYLNKRVAGPRLAAELRRLLAGQPSQTSGGGTSSATRIEASHN